ncbi:hypothetical protein [Ferruginibacter sp.]
MTKKPPFRKLRGYAFDPSLSLTMDTASINDIVYKIPWEKLEPGPSGEYVEVIDFDPTVNKFYKPVNLDDTFVLVQDGLDPSEGDPCFHQQMVYAVSMLTIKNFERALGRKILWSFQRVLDERYELYVPKLRIYPHALREANAYYSPVKKALLFGYFSAAPIDETLNMPDSLVFTCLSHDIIAHETTHAILDGMHGNFNEATNPDMLAFHEAFADIVALFQHFTFPQVLEHQIAKTRGDLSTQNLLGQLAQQFGTAIGSYGSLRDAIGKKDEVTGAWTPIKPDPDDYRNVKEPHERGSILVAAVFEAFISIYKSRIGDLMRIASDGTGVLRQGDLHPDLVKRLATEASKAAGHVLNMCIRALDYCPPVDLSFGDYLRAIVTADLDLVAEDSRDYRLAFIDAFRRRGIYPEGIKTLSVESLRFPLLNIGFTGEPGQEKDKNIAASYRSGTDTQQLLGIIISFLRDYGNAIKYVSDREEISKITRKYIGGSKKDDIEGLHTRVKKKFEDSVEFGKLTGLVFTNDAYKLGIRKSVRYNGPAFQILNLRLVSRVGPDGNQINEVIFSIFQKSGILFADGVFKDFFVPDPSFDIHNPGKLPPPVPENGFEFKGGCTLIFDLDAQKLKYAIGKSLVDMDEMNVNNKLQINMKRVEMQYRMQNNADDQPGNEFALYFGAKGNKMAEPFAFLHQH